MTIERLGPYKIGGRLGRGGMGTVYEAVNHETGEPAAVKLLLAGLAQEAGFRQRFEAEIETLRKLNHPNIVRLFGFGEEDEYLYYAMELVRGSSLEDQISRGRCFQWREATHLAIEVCRALRHAHDRGVVHRDIKPGNLLLTEEGHVKLSDFGIARLFWNARLTGAGSVLGTAEYMAPEQALARPVDPRADLYSLGAVLYVLLARRPVFRGRTFAEIVEKQRFEEPVPLRRYAPDAPAELEQIIGQLLEKLPERRIVNAMLLSRRLEAMEHALTLHEAASGAEAEPDPAAPPRIDLLAATRDLIPCEPPLALDVVRAPEAAMQRAVELPDHPGKEVLPETRSVSPPGSLAAASPSEEIVKPGGRFTRVAPEELDQPEAAAPPTPWISPQTWVLASGLIVVGLLAWYLLQPPSADALYARIHARTGAGSAETLVQAEDDIQQFLARFPDDSRCEYLREHEREIELGRLERRLELRAKGLASRDPLLPIENTYLDALNYARIDPAVGLAKFQALIVLYGDRQNSSGPVAQCLELARRRIAHLRKQIGEQAPEHLQLVQDRLARADESRATDPANAEAVYRAVIELYQHYPWAADVVRQARAALEQTRHKNPEAEKRPDAKGS